ncbi:MAG: hypothetical protein DRQ88_04055 [Epsilonproteobacteria bacterium]|nr:MAG: hypothetical protein DRQ88_04055 [Campylobacterota bacterium]
MTYRKKPIRSLFKKVFCFYKILYKYITSISFLTISTSSIILILINSYLFYTVELDMNPKVESFFDCFYWAVTTTTTVGYGDISPVTTTGKIIGMFAMVSGGLLFAIFTGLFAQSLFQDEEINELFKK